MFTGIVKEIGEVSSLRSERGRVRLVIHAPQMAKGLKKGDSVSVSGVCLTVVGFSHKAKKAKKVKSLDRSRVAGHGSSAFEVDVIPETLSLTSLKKVSNGDRVNLEPAMKVGHRLDGHIVQGHVDGTGRVIKIQNNRGETRLTIALAKPLMRYVAKKGSIAIEGVSLTVAERTASSVTVALIPYTLRHTTLGGLGQGDIVNIEVDVLARYAEVVFRGRNKYRS